MLGIVYRATSFSSFQSGAKTRPFLVFLNLVDSENLYPDSGPSLG